MKERMEKEIQRLTGMRDDILSKYLDALENFNAEEGGIPVIARASILHDLDRHITNLHLELRRFRLEEAGLTTADAIASRAEVYRG